VNRLGGITKRRVLYGLVALIVVGGFGLALLSNSGIYGIAASSTLAPRYVPSNMSAAASNAVGGATYFMGPPGASYGAQGTTQVLGVPTTTVTMTSTTSMATTTSAPPTGASASGQYYNVTQGSPGSHGGMIEFSTDLAITAPMPNRTASAVSALAYSVGGYVAYQSTYSTAAYVVIRVPASAYQNTLNQVMKLGVFVSETSNSNDVSVQYTDMNATLASLRTEQLALLKLLNQTASINSTLAVETQLQQVDSQINSVESELLQTKTLVDYSTINVTITQTAQKVPLAMTLSAIPVNGTAPLSVTFNAIVKGGGQPYVVNYNFGDGTATEGQIVIHTYYQAGDYKVVVTATDQNGTVVQQFATVKVVVAPSPSGISGFFGYVGGLFLNVIEGIVEVAVVVLPLAAVGAAIVIPIQRRGRPQKSVKQNQ
jgi:PKD repeat protein